MSQKETLDKGAVFGAVLCTLIVGAGVATSGMALKYLDLASLAIVFGGTFGAALIHFSLNDIRRAFHSVRAALTNKAYAPLERISLLVALAHDIREEGLLVLEREAANTDDRFLKLSLEVTVDGQDVTEVRRILENEITTSTDQAARAVQVFQTMGGYAPAMGLIGTLLGLIQMLGALNNPATVGPAMSLALVATLYGAVLSNFVFLPVAGKLRNKSEEELLVKALTLEGIVSLAKQENPIIIEQRLRTFLPGIGAV